MELGCFVRGEDVLVFPDPRNPVIIVMGMGAMAPASWLEKSTLQFFDIPKAIIQDQRMLSRIVTANFLNR